MPYASAGKRQLQPLRRARTTGTYARLREEKIQNGVPVNHIKNVKLIRDNEQYQSFLDAAQVTE